MRLKISPKAALVKIDTLTKKGSELLDFISKDYWIQEEKAEKLDKKRKQIEEKKFDEEIKNTPLINQTHLRLARTINTNQVTLGNSWVVPNKIIKIYQTDYDNWFESVENSLKDIYEDFIPTYLFSHANVKVERTDFPFTSRAYEDFKLIKAHLESEIFVLVKLYKELQNNIKSPLIYLSDKAQICFYDFICQLTANTTETELCNFLFKSSIGELKEHADAYAYINGEDIDMQHEWDKNWQRKIINAYDGINKKTIKSFGFPIIRKEKTLIGLNLPTRFIKELK